MWSVACGRELWEGVVVGCIAKELGGHPPSNTETVRYKQRRLDGDGTLVLIDIDVV